MDWAYSEVKSLQHIVFGGILCFQLGFLTPLVVRAQETSLEHVWTGEEVQAIAASRLSEVLRSLGPLRQWSSDRYGMRFPGSGLGGSHGMGPALIVDGHQMTFQFMDRNWHDLAPISPSDIERLSVSSGLQLHDGGSISDGSIRITTRKPKGFSLRGSVALVNETGDPGPTIYQDASLQNVDRSGPTSNLRLSYGSTAWFAQIALDTDAYHMTDDRIRRRVWRVFRGDIKPVVDRLSPSLRLLFKKDRFSFDVWAGRTFRNNFLLDEIAGWEWPLQEDWKWLNSRIALRLFPAVQSGATLVARSLQTNNHPSAVDLPNPTLLREAKGEAYLSFRARRHLLTTAVGGTINDMQQQRSVSRDKFALVHSRISLSSAWTERTATKLDGHVSSPIDVGVSTNAWSWSSFFELSRLRSTGGHVRFSVAAESKIPRSIWNTLGWIQEGMQFDAWAGAYSWPGSVTRSTTMEVMLVSRSPLSEKVSALIELSARQFQGLTLPDRIHNLHEGSGTFRPVSRYQIGRSGRILSPSLSFLMKLEHRTTVRLGYQYLHLIANQDLLFWKHFTGLAPHRVTASIKHSPTQRLHLRASMEIGSPRLWPEYAPAWESKRPWQSYIEGSVTKDLWADNLSLALSLLNIPDTENLNHPTGTNDQLAIRLTVRTRFTDREDAK